MERQKKQFLALLAMVVILGAAFFGLRAWQNHQKDQEAEAKEAETITVASLDMDQITGFSYLLEGQELSFEKEGDTWHYSGDKSIAIRQTAIDTMLGNLSEVKAKQQLTAPENTAEYGFADPANVITLRFPQEEMTFTIGMYNSITGQYYLMVSGDENVYLVDSQIVSAFGRSLEELTETEEEQ